MFCYQCEQTARGSSCTGRTGVCGKSTQVANHQNELTGALIVLAYLVEHFGIRPVSTPENDLKQILG